MIAGRYTLEREIGRGGAGVVHLARDEVLGRSVAIKRLGLLPGTTEDDIARAEREARLAAGINHPHVVSILDLVKDEDCYWLVMEHVQGRTLTEVIAAEGPLAPTRAAAIIAQIVSDEQANVVEVLHTQHDAWTSITDVSIDISVTTRGPEHAQRVLEALRRAGYEPQVL